MKRLFQKLFSPEMRAKTIVAFLIIVVAATVLLGMQIHRSIIRSRTVTQASIAEGWQAAGLELASHPIRRKENFWKIAKEYGVDIDAVVGANQGLGTLHAALGQTIRVPNRRGAHA